MNSNKGFVPNTLPCISSFPVECLQTDQAHSHIGKEEIHDSAQT